MTDVEKMQERIAIDAMISDLPRDDRNLIKKYISEYKKLLRGKDVSLESIAIIVMFYKIILLSEDKKWKKWRKWKNLTY